MPTRAIVNDSAGNSDGIVNPGEDISYQVWFRNDGSQPATGLVTRLRHTGTLLTISDSLAALPDFAPGESALADFAFSVNLLAIDHDIAYLDITTSDSSSHAWTTRLALAIGTPVLELKDYLFTDSTPGGNSNGIPEPGEEVSLMLRVRNVGLGFGYGLTAGIQSLDSGLTVTSPGAAFGTIPPDSVAISQVPVIILINSACPSPHTAWLRLSASTTPYSLLPTPCSESIPLMVGGAGFVENFDASAPGWEYGGTGNLWHLSQRRSESPTWSFYSGDETSGRYNNDITSWLLSPPFIAGPQSRLSFQRWFDVPIYGADGLYVIIDHDSVSDTLDYIGTGGALPEHGIINTKTPSHQREDLPGNLTTKTPRHQRESTPENLNTKTLRRKGTIGSDSRSSFVPSSLGVEASSTNSRTSFVPLCLGVESGFDSLVFLKVLKVNLPPKTESTATGSKKTMT